MDFIPILHSDKAVTVVWPAPRRSNASTPSIGGLPRMEAIMQLITDAIREQLIANGRASIAKAAVQVHLTAIAYNLKRTMNILSVPA